MTPSPSFDAWSPQRRRTVLRLAGAAAGTGALGQVLAQRDDPGETVVLEQGDRCLELVPLSGDVPVEELYDYTYPTNLFDGPPGSLGTTYSSMGTTDLQRDRTSILFLYDGPEGLSLVVVHGHVGSEDDAGGTVSFTLGGVPADAAWIVRDDYYLQNGEQADSNHDRWDVDGTIQVVDWAYKGGRTDGGALRGLGPEFDLTIDPAFNGEAGLAEELSYYGPIEAWEALSGDREDPERFPLRLDQHVRIHTGSCDGATAGDGATEEETADEAAGEDADETVEDDATEDAQEETTDEDTQETTDEDTREETANEDPEESPSEGETDDATGESAETTGGEAEEGGDDEDERRSRKHERKQEKHRRKHRKRQRKHERKHERKRRKHERKHGGNRGNRGKKRGADRGRGNRGRGND